MIFTLEALQAKHGDALILYYGKKSDPKVIVIDGGPAGIYKGFLKPRLLSVKQKLSPGDPLSISMVMVSHLDDDHVNGILGLANEIADKKEENKAVDFDFTDLWVNTFDDIIGNIQIPKVAAAASMQPANIGNIPEFAGARHEISAVIASTGQGRKLRDLANKLAVTVNHPFKSLKPGKSNLVRGDGKGKAIKWDDISITVVHPNQQRLEELQTKWDKDLQKAKEKGDPSISIASIIDPDTSPFNLSSIVCLVKAGKKTMLLTGDARADDILEGLKLNKMLDKKGKLHVDILKVPHHGSSRNQDKEFFEAITAEHYVVSADGAHHNPDADTLQMLIDAKIKGTLYLTNQDGKLGLKKVVADFLKNLKKSKSKLKVVFRKETSPSIVINLGEKINF